MLSVLFSIFDQVLLSVAFLKFTFSEKMQDEKLYLSFGHDKSRKLFVLAAPVISRSKQF